MQEGAAIIDCAIRKREGVHDREPPLSYICVCKPRRLTIGLSANNWQINRVLRTAGSIPHRDHATLASQLVIGKAGDEVTAKAIIQFCHHDQTRIVESRVTAC